MRKLSLFATLAAVAVLVTALGAQLAGAHDEEIVFNTRNVKAREIFDNPGTLIGDKVVIIATLKEGGTVHGRMRQECTSVSVTGSFQCLATVSIDRGAITAQGFWPASATTEKLAITGGTEEFVNHGGTLHWDTEENVLRLDVRHPTAP